MLTGCVIRDFFIHFSFHVNLSEHVMHVWWASFNVFIMAECDEFYFLLLKAACTLSSTGLPDYSASPAKRLVFTVFMGTNGELNPNCLRMLFRSPLPGYRVSEEEERSINDYVLLVNGISENDSSRMACAPLRNRHEVQSELWGVFCQMICGSDEIVLSGFQLLTRFPAKLKTVHILKTSGVISYWQTPILMELAPFIIPLITHILHIL